MLKIRQLFVNYGKNVVLDKISVDFLPFQIHGIFGINGSGKTSFFNTIYGFLPNDTEIYFGDKILTKKDVGYLESTNFFYSYTTGKEYLDIFQESKEPTYNEIELVNALKIPINELIEHYSEGMKKKLALLSILKLNRKVLLLDEPFNGIDIESVYLIKGVLEELRKQGKVILISSHIVETLYDLCDDFYIIENKKIICLNDKESFKNYCNDVYTQISKSVTNAFLMNK